MFEQLIDVFEVFNKEIIPDFLIH